MEDEGDSGGVAGRKRAGGRYIGAADYVVFALSDLLAADITSLTFEELVRLTTGGTLTLPAGQTRAIISIRTRQDPLAEADETLQVVLSNPTQATLAKAAATGTIRDDDPVRRPDLF